jgi:cation:H+ antiporter
MILTTLVPITTGIILIWISAEKLEKYSIAAAKKFGMSPFFIGSTVIAFGTSAPEMLTSFFAGLDNKGQMIIGNIIGSNVANLSLVFGITLFIIALKKQTIVQSISIIPNLGILILSTILTWFFIATNPFSISTSAVLLLVLVLVITFWYKTNSVVSLDNSKEVSKNFVTVKLISSLLVLIFAAWLITKGATNILNSFNLGELFVGYTVLAIGTSLPEIAAATSLALKGRYEAVAGTLIGSNIFNGLCVLAIPGLMNRPEMSLGWNYENWSFLLLILMAITVFFSLYIYQVTRQAKKASLFLSLIFLSTYFISLGFAY